jgi:hypothetical protein
VVVEEEAAKRSRSKLHAVTFKEWIKGMDGGIISKND